MIAPVPNIVSMAKTLTECQASRLILEIDIGELLPFVVAHHKQASNSLTAGSVVQQAMQ
jgi:hypothetical protein